LVLMVVAGLVFLQWRYSNGLKASPPVEKPSAAQPSEAESENPEAKQEDALAQKNEAESANPESDTAADAQDESKSGANSAATTKSPSDARPSAKDEAKKPAEKAAGEEPKVSSAGQQESATGEAEEPAGDETAQESKPATKPSPRSGAQREQVADVSDEPVRLAENYLLGRGLPQSCPQAVSILREAANRGNYKAQIKLGALYATGNCVSQDRVQAYRFFTRALQGKPGNTWVEQNRSMLWARMSDQERRQAMEHSF
jgi:TPR repeat protein